MLWFLSALLLLAVVGWALERREVRHLLAEHEAQRRAISHYAEALSDSEARENAIRLELLRCKGASREFEAMARAAEERLRQAVESEKPILGDA